MEKHILLIDDDMDEPEIFINALREAKVLFKCTWAGSAEEGMRLLQQLKPDIILLDFNMPKINGLEMLQRLKKNIGLKNIPVVMYSATMDKELKAKAIQFGALACVRKPYNMQELPALLQPFLQNSFF